MKPGRLSRQDSVGWGQKSGKASSRAKDLPPGTLNGWDPNSIRQGLPAAHWAAAFRPHHLRYQPDLTGERRCLGHHARLVDPLSGMRAGMARRIGRGSAQPSRALLGRGTVACQNARQGRGALRLGHQRARRRQKGPARPAHRPGTRNRLSWGQAPITAAVAPADEGEDARFGQLRRSPHVVTSSSAPAVERRAPLFSTRRSGPDWRRRQAKCSAVSRTRPCPPAKVPRCN